MWFKKQNFTFSRSLAWFILFSIACGPGPLDFEEFFTLFDPKISTRPPATEPYFFTHNYLSFSSDSPSSEMLADSLNIETWVQYTNGKITREEFKKGLYESEGGHDLILKLQQIGKNEAATYLQLTRQIDKETEKYSNDWQPAEPLNEQLLGDYREQALNQILLAREDFIKERYVFQITKINAKLNEYGMLIDDHSRLSEEYKTRTYISEWIESRVAGAHLALGDTARAVLEFSRIFAQSPTRRNQADLSVRRLANHYFSGALKLAQNTEDKLALYALQGIQPYQDGLDLMEKIAEADPNYPLLELIMTREINKNEVNFYAGRGSGLYSWNMDIYDENYEVDSAKIIQVQDKAASYFDQLKTFSEAQAGNNSVKNPDFWYACTAYLEYIAEDFEAMKENIDKVSSSNPALKKQVNFLDLLYELETGDFSKKEIDLLNKLAAYRPAENFRDNNLLVFLSEKLEARYIQNTFGKTNGGLLSSCSSKESQRKDDNASVKAFLARAYGASDFDYTYETGITKPGMLDKADEVLLQNVLRFISNPQASGTDKKLIELASLDLNATRMVYARKLVKTQQYEEALAVFNQMPDSTLNSETFLTYFSPIPRQYIGYGTPDESLLNPKAYFEKVVDYKRQTEKSPKNAQVWYNLGLAAYNMSYWGNGWLFSERYWSSAEIEYGQPTETDYYTNSYAKMCFDKALSAKPDPELAAKICYMGALCERNAYYISYALGKPKSFNQEEIDAYHIRMETKVKPEYQTYFKKLKTEFDETAYESEVIKECITYVNYKLQ